MFIGEYTHNLDSKGRLAVPVKFREALKGGAVVTRGIDKCLTLYSIREWRKIADRERRRAGFYAVNARRRHGG